LAVNRNQFPPGQGAESLDEAETIHFRHHVIDNHQIRQIVAAPFECLQRIFEQYRLAFPQFQYQGPDQSQVDIAIVDDQHLIHGALAC